MLLKQIGKILLGTSVITGTLLLANSPSKAATFSEIPLDAVTIEYEEPPISTLPLTLGFQVSIANIPEIDSSVKLTRFTAAVANPSGDIFRDNFRIWEGFAAPGWRAFGSVPENGWVFEVINPENGIAPGDTLSGFIARSSAGSIANTSLRVTSISSTSAVPEPTSELLNALIFSAFIGTGVIIKRQRKQQKPIAQTSDLP
jgi:hypothetical protein